MFGRSRWEDCFGHLSDGKTLFSHSMNILATHTLSGNRRRAKAFLPRDVSSWWKANILTTKSSSLSLSVIRQVNEGPWLVPSSVISTFLVRARQRSWKTCVHISPTRSHGAQPSITQERYAERLIEFPTLSFLVLSDLWLDHPQTLNGLRRVLEGCIENDFIPFVFIFCGNFATRGVDQTSGAGLAKYQGIMLSYWGPYHVYVLTACPTSRKL